MDYSALREFYEAVCVDLKLSQGNWEVTYMQLSDITRKYASEITRSGIVLIGIDTYIKLYRRREEATRYTNKKMLKVNDVHNAN